MISTTNRDYDLGETSKAVRGLLIGLAIVRPLPLWSMSDVTADTLLDKMGFMHLYLKYTQPLFIQSILPLKGLYESQVSPSRSLRPWLYLTYNPPPGRPNSPLRSTRNRILQATFRRRCRVHDPRCPRRRGDYREDHRDQGGGQEGQVGTGADAGIRCGCVVKLGGDCCFGRPAVISPLTTCLALVRGLGARD